MPFLSLNVGFLTTDLWVLEGLCVGCYIFTHLYCGKFIRLERIFRKKSYSMFALNQREVMQKPVSMGVTIRIYRPHKPYIISDYFRWVQNKDFLPKVLNQRIAKKSMSKLFIVFFENLKKILRLLKICRGSQFLCSSCLSKANHLVNVLLSE